MKDEGTSKIEYHYGFYAAVHFEYASIADVTFLQEYELGEKPARLDMLIIKHNGKAALRDPIGSFFRTYNVLEYKSPEDGLSIDDFYKVQAYACLYKALGKTVDAIPVRELTVSIFRHAYPRRLFDALQEIGFEVAEAHPGVYRVRGPLCIPAQVVVTSRLADGGYEAFKILSKDARETDVSQFMGRAYQSPGTRQYAGTILKVTIAANETLFQKLKKRGIMMGAFERLFKEELAAGREEGLREGLREASQIIMERLIAGGISPEQAASFTELPA